MERIKLIVFDFDNVLASLAEAHFTALNTALSDVNPKFAISHQEQIEKFEGLTTRDKLHILVNERNFPVNRIEEVFKKKQDLTAQAIEQTIEYSPRLVELMSFLKNEGYVLYVASNAIKDTIVSGLTKIGILSFFEKVLSNEDVSRNKPDPAIYLKAMLLAESEPRRTLIIEDSLNGKEAALRSGAHLCDVNNPGQTTKERIMRAIEFAESSNLPLKHAAKHTLRVLIPMSGAGARLAAHYANIKPLIDINGKTMIQRAISSLNIDAHHVFIVQKAHYEKYNLGAYLKLISPGCSIVQTAGLTEGAAVSTLLAKSYIDNDEQLLIANCDQILDWSPQKFLFDALAKNADGSILTFHKENDPKWSYAAVNEKGWVTQVIEKKPISNKATIGLYYFKKGSDYVKYAERMIIANDRVNNEFYVAPVYNYLINDGKKVVTYDVPESSFYPTGTVDDLEKVLKDPKFR